MQTGLSQRCVGRLVKLKDKFKMQTGLRLSQGRLVQGKAVGISICKSSIVP